MPEDPGSESSLDAWERSLAEGELPLGLRQTDHATGTWWANAVQEHRDHSGTWAWPGAHGVDFVCVDCDEVHTVPMGVITASGWVTTAREWLDWLRSNAQGWGWLRVTEDRAGMVSLGAWRRVTAPMTEGHTRLCVVQGDWIASLTQHADHVGLISGFFSERLTVSPGEPGELHPHVGFRCRQCNVDDRLSLQALEDHFTIFFANAQFSHLLPAVALFGAGLLDTFTLRQIERAHIEEWRRARVRAAMQATPAPVYVGTDRVAPSVQLDGGVPMTWGDVRPVGRPVESLSRQAIYEQARVISSDADFSSSYAAGYAFSRGGDGSLGDALTRFPLQGFASAVAERITSRPVLRRPDTGAIVEDFDAFHGGPLETGVTPMAGTGPWVNAATRPENLAGRNPLEEQPLYPFDDPCERIDVKLTLTPEKPKPSWARLVRKK